MPHPKGKAARPSGRMDKRGVRCHLDQMFRICALVLSSLLLACPCRADSVAGFATVVSGDIIQIEGITLRLAWIDAPEPRQRCTRADGKPWDCGAAATRALSEMVWRKSIHCNEVRPDPAGATQAICTADGIDLAAAIVANGWAVVRDSGTSQYQAEQEQARTQMLGIWDSSFEMPWLWRGER